MRKLFVSLILVSTIWSVRGQDFPGKYVALLVGKHLKVTEKQESKREFGYVGFYKEKTLDNVYRVKQGSYYTPYVYLVGKEFEVKGITPYTNSVGLEKQKLELYNPDMGKVYFDYDPKNETHFPFKVIGGLVLPPDFYCEDVEKDYDKFSGEMKFNTRYVDGLSIVASKKKEGNREYYLSLEVIGNALEIDKKGVVILLSNGQKINLPKAALKVKINGNNQYKYSAFVSLSQQHLNLLKAFAITDVRLYVYDRVIKRGYKIKEYVKCIERSMRTDNSN